MQESPNDFHPSLIASLYLSMTYVSRTFSPRTEFNHFLYLGYLKQVLKDVHKIDISEDLMSTFYYIHHSDKSLAIPQESNGLR